jgi:hypothetical protein
MSAHNDQVYAKGHGMGFARDVVEEMRRSMVRPGPFVCAIGHTELTRGFCADAVAVPLDQQDQAVFDRVSPGATVTHFRLSDRRGTEVGTFPLTQSETYPAGGSFVLAVTITVEGRRYSPKAFYDSADTVWPKGPGGVQEPTADELEVASARAVRAPSVPSFTHARPMAPVRPKELEA